MVFAADYPLLQVFWTILIFFAWVVWIWMMVVILTDLFRRRDISGWGKAAWCVFMILVPFIGVLAYLIVEHDGMAERSAQQAQASKAEFDQYVREVAGHNGGNGGAAAEIERAEQLLSRGAISQAEFDRLKEQALATH
jgi:Tfp pilus assembly protein PilO